MTDTNTDPTLVDFAIPANDDASKSIAIIVGAIAQAIAEGLNERRMAREKQAADDEAEKEAREIKVKQESLEAAEEMDDKEAIEKGKKKEGVQKLREGKEGEARPKRARKPISKTKKN